jgi:HEAT repeat protein
MNKTDGNEERMSTKFLVPILLMLVPSAVAIAQQTPIEQRVAAAIESARKGNQRPVALLKKDPELAKGLPYLRRFVTDPDSLVKSSVLALAAGVHTPEAVGILTDLMKEDNGRWAEASVKAFYPDYDCRELIDVGGSRLRDSLIYFVENRKGLSIGKAILILSCFKGDKEAVRLLESLDKGQQKKIALNWNNSVDIATGVDLALAEIGEKEAAERFVQRVGRGETNDLIFAFTAIRFINEKEVLSALVERIEDKRPATYPWSDDFYLRIGDLAVNALAEKAQKPLGISIKNNYRYSDEELEKAYSILRIHFKR